MFTNVPATSDATRHLGSLPEETDWYARVCEALKWFSQSDKLVSNSLLNSLIVEQRTGLHASRQNQIQKLRDLLVEEIQQLKKHPRTQSMGTALFHAYIEPSEKMAESARKSGMTEATFFRNRKLGIEAIATNLWLREQHALWLREQHPE